MVKIIQPSIEIMTPIDREYILKHLEKCGRTCYKSEDKITEDSASKFVKMIKGRKHDSVLEHISVTVRVICDRGVSHEIVRHRIGCSYSQESTRYCCYSNDKFGNEITVISPCFWNKYSEHNAYERERRELFDEWEQSMEDAERHYNELISLGATAQEARSVLPNSLKTEVVMTLNLRAWIHFFNLRCAPSAHPQMIEVATMIRDEFVKVLPEVFGE